MSTLHSRFPSKTFLLGEYIVLDQAPCLILTTEPYFEMQLMLKSPRTTCDPLFQRGYDLSMQQTPFSKGVTLYDSKIFHPQSPAGLWIKKHADFFNDYQLRFLDPHQGKGGFGASGAEFLGVYNAIYPIQKNIAFIQKLITDYQYICTSEYNILPSGADLVAQIYGDVTYWHRAESIVASEPWPFQNLTYYLMRTGQKCITHKAIKKLPNPVVETLSTITKEGYVAFKACDEISFIKAIQEYANWMEKENCLSANSNELVKKLYGSGLIRAAKGCGTMGADVVVVLLDREKAGVFSKWMIDRSPKEK
jgi:mevalonate kinase